jgi:hypothetical protein
MCLLKMLTRKVLHERCVSISCTFKIHQEHDIDYRFVVGGFLQGKLAS